MGKLSELAMRISGALEDKRRVKTRKVHIEELEMDFTLEGLPAEKLEEILGTPLSAEQKARMLVYEAAPALHDAAKELAAAGVIGDNVDVLKAFHTHEMILLMQEVLKLSGASGKNRVILDEEVETLKNV